MKMHDRVIIPCDDDKVIAGTIVGTTTTIVDPRDIHHPWSETGTMYQNYIVRLDSDFTGEIGRFDNEDNFKVVEPRIPVDLLVVHEDNVEVGPWFVNVYEVDYGYGGPEEGGWYFNVYDHIDTVRCDTFEEAERTRENLREGQYADDPDARVSSVVYSGGVYSISIEAVPGKDSNTYQPYR
jgi:hypothetical protein